VMRTVGNNPAEQVTAVLVMHHDQETLAWSDEPLLDLGPRGYDGTPSADAILTSDAPPWWRVKKKNALFYNGMARGDHRGTMELATSVCVDDLEQAERVDAWFKDIQAFISTLQAPRYPRSIDAELARAGHSVYERDCAGCHGKYAEDPDDDAHDSYPNLLIPLDVVGTDPAVARAAVSQPDLLAWYNGSFYGKVTPIVPDDPFLGYVPPPLDGIWATPPYLHNGSVPSVELVLNSKARPAVWKRVDYDTTHIDEDSLGWPFVALDYPQAEAPADEQKYVYDTSYFSQSNRGHTFGDHLSDGERRAVIEYLKTL
jgi:mono/diheme cytochrome c family protein